MSTLQLSGPIDALADDDHDLDALMAYLVDEKPDPEVQACLDRMMAALADERPLPPCSALRLEELFPRVPRSKDASRAMLVDEERAGAGMISPGACPSAERSPSVATQATRRRKAADASSKRTIKTSLTLDVDLHARLNAAASLAGTSTNAYVVDVLTEALRGLILIDKRKTAGQDDSSSE